MIWLVKSDFLTFTIFCGIFCGAGVLFSNNYFSFQKRIQNLGLSFIYRDLKCLVNNEAYV